MTETVFFDIDTQYDFVYPAGALYVPGAEKLLGVIERLNQFAIRQTNPLISTACAHRENDPEFRQWPPHCVEGTLGQQKPSRLLSGKMATIRPEPEEPLPLSPHYLLLKRELDCFSNPNLERLLRQLGSKRAVVYGVVTEYCVRCAAMGLLRLGHQVEVVEDAIQTLNPADGEKFYREFRQGGGTLTTVDKVL